MPPPIGTEVYIADQTPVRARGYSFNQTELGSMLAQEVRAILQDDTGRAELETLLAGIPSTDFEHAALQQVLNTNSPVENWRVGEAIAESYLVGHRNCQFPWPGGRDLKNPLSSPAGTDLVGFQLQESSARFSFGEVKTSSQQEYPPSVMDGRHGLTMQLQGLRDSAFLKDTLVKYLGFHATGRPWASTYQSAAKRYLHDRSDISIFGILVRDVEPNSLDCSARAARLADQCPPSTSIELFGMYFPEKSIDRFQESTSLREEAQ